MERVIGVGGIFFKARDPEALLAWYRDHLGIESKDGYFEFGAGQSGTPADAPRTVWSVFPVNTEYFGPNSRELMINYRVASLDRMLEQLKTAGIAVLGREDYPYGRFAWVNDPEGNRIELWEPIPT